MIQNFLFVKINNAFPIGEKPAPGDYKPIRKCLYLDIIMILRIGKSPFLCKLIYVFSNHWSVKSD